MCGGNREHMCAAQWCWCVWGGAWGVDNTAHQAETSHMKHTQTRTMCVFADSHTHTHTHTQSCCRLDYTLHTQLQLPRHPTP